MQLQCNYKSFYGVRMAVKPKTAVFQIRVDPELLEQFRTAVEHVNFTVSDTLRRYMEHRVRVFAAEQAEALKQFTPALRSVPLASVSALPQVSSPVKRDRLTRAELKKIERQKKGVQ